MNTQRPEGRVISPLKTRDAQLDFARRVPDKWVLRLSLLGSLTFLHSIAEADTTLTVDLSTTIRPATRVASGSLYGVTESLPADVEGLIAPLRPNMFTNPAENIQQPHGDAFLVAERIASTGARVTIRLADWLPGWPYNFPGMSEWLTKVGQSVTRKQQSGLDNIYGYEIWNEPDGTWTDSTPFNDFWKQTYDELKDLDPNAAIIGPSYSYYRSTDLRAFLTFARDNQCLPDIVAWHELSGGDVASHFDDYRAMEGELGIGPLPISINEYSGAEHIEDEGQPGASAPLIAKFERMGIDTACLTYWDVPHPGRLGTLLADDTNKNGGWWFYKWYGDMTGDMVDTIPAANNNVTTLDGFANLDLEERFASVLFAGENDGTIRVVVKGFSATGLFGDTVHAVVEQTPWVDRSTVVNATALLSEDDLTIADDEIEITVPNANNFDGYRIYLTSNEPVNTGTGGNGSGGGDGAGGSEGTGGGPVVSAGGATGTGGALGVGTGGAADASGGMAASPTGGMTSGGTDGGISSGGSSSGGSGDGVGPDDDSPETAGCSCRSSGGGPSSPTTMMMVLGLSGLIFSRRRRSSCSAISVS